MALKFDVFQLQRALYRGGVTLRIDGGWHLDTELSLGVLVEGFDETWTAEANYGDAEVYITPGGKPQYDPIVVARIWFDMQRKVATTNPPRPAGPQVHFVVSDLQRALYMPPPVSGEYDIATESALLAAMPDTQLLVLDADSGSLDLRIGAEEVILWGHGGDVLAPARLTVPPPVAAVPPVATRPEAASPAPQAFPMSPSPMPPTPPFPTPEPVDANEIMETPMPALVETTHKPSEPPTAEAGFALTSKMLLIGGGIAAGVGLLVLALKGVRKRKS